MLAWRSHLRASIAGLRTGGDVGMSLIELLVSMVIMSIAMAVFTSVVIQVFRVENDIELVARAQSQVNIAFVRLDKEIRYAAGISQPDSSFVEFLRTDGTSPTCAELWLDPAARQLKRRTWALGTTPASNWTILVSDVSSAHPFTFLPAAAPYYYQRLQVQFIASPSGSTRTKPMSTTFTALNTSLATASDTICTEGRQVP